MNRRHSGLLASIVCLAAVVSLMTAPPAQAQDQTIPLQVKTATSFGPMDRQTVQSYIQPRIELLGDQNPTVQSQAREELIAGATTDDRRGPSRQYLDLYAATLTDAMADIPDNPDLRTRVNAAIVVGKVAEASGSPELRPILVRFVSDPSPAVTLWGFKGAKWIAPKILADPQLRQDRTLRDAVIPAVQLHAESGLSGPIAVEAYEVLSLDPFAGVPMTDDMIQAVIPFAQDLLAARIEQYQTRLPAYPLAERRPTQFLTFGRVWQLQTPEQQVRTMQLLSDLVSISGQWLAISPIEVRTSLAPLIEQTARAIIVAIQSMPSDTPGVQGAVNAADQAATIGRQLLPEQIWERVQPIYPAITQVPQFQDLAPPPNIQFGEPEEAIGEEGVEGAEVMIEGEEGEMAPDGGMTDGFEDAEPMDGASGETEDSGAATGEMAP